MRILLVSTDNPYVESIGGKHVHLLLLEKELRELGNDVGVLYPPKVGRLKRNMMILLKNPFLLTSKLRRSIAWVNILTHFFDKDLIEYDVVNSHDVVSTFGINHTNLVLTVHGRFSKEISSIFKSEKERKSMEKFAREIEIAAFEKAKKIIAVSRSIKDYIENFGIGPEKITVIYNAVNTDRFSPVSEEEKRLIRKELGLPVNDWIIFIPKRFVHESGVFIAAEAVKLLKRNDIFWIFAGRGPKKAELKKTLSNMENVMITGIPHSVVDKYYKASDVILIPSVEHLGIKEALGISLLEGMACGKIVICTRVGGMKEVIKDGENGFLIDQKSPEAIAEKIEYVLNRYDELEGVRRSAREYVLKNHSPVEHAKKFLEIYKEVINR